MLFILRCVAPLILSAAGSGVVCAESPAIVEGRPNVLVLLLDDAGYHDFGFMGSDEIPTPNIDRLAASGVVFTDAHLSGTTCSPSRAGIMTGRYQQRFGHHNNVPPHGSGMDPAESTVGDAFSAGGYKTYYVGKWHLGAVQKYHPNNRGFDEFFGLLEGSRSYFPNENNDKRGGTKSIERNGGHVVWDGYLTDLFTDSAVEYLEEPRDQPFFMILSYTAPHTPMHAKRAHLKKFAGHPRQKLAAMLWSADEGVGRVLETLERIGARENTIVFFLSDNGGPIENNSNNYPLKGCKGTKFEGGQRTPFIVSWPAKAPAGSQYDGLVSALDVYPTAAAAAGVDSTIGEPLDGVDLLPYVLGDEAGDPHEILFWHRSIEHAARSGDYKLIGHEEHGWRLFDVNADIGETRDVLAEHPEVADRLRERLTAWEAELAEPLWTESPEWNDVKVEMYRAWLDGEEPRYTNPSQMRRRRAGTR